MAHGTPRAAPVNPDGAAGLAGEGAGRPSPIIVTLQLDETSTAFFESRRRDHFPPARNRVPAHLTLFHHLPGAAVDTVMGAVAAAAAQQPPFPVAVTGVMPLGQGVAYALASARLTALRAQLASRLAPLLHGQDRAPFRPHVTVQNAVCAPTASATLAALAPAFVPFTALAEGIQLWRYRGGPWQAIGATAFTS